MRTGLTLLLVLVGACSADTQPALVASDVTITQPMPGMTMSAGYLTLTNNTEETITITRVSSPSYASVELHETVVDDGIARMRRARENRDSRGHKDNPRTRWQTPDADATHQGCGRFGVAAVL